KWDTEREKTEQTHRTGRAKRKSPFPQRWTLGNLIFLITSGNTSAMISEVNRPPPFLWATTTSPLGVILRFKEAAETPCALAKPSPALVGNPCWSKAIETRGPVTSWLESCCISGKPLKKRVNRRGV